MTTRIALIKLSALTLPLLLAPLGALAQEAAPASPASVKAEPVIGPSTVAIKGKHLIVADPAVIDAARDRILSANNASSCAYIGGSGYDDVTLEYMREFGSPNSYSPRYDLGYRRGASRNDPFYASSFNRPFGGRSSYSTGVRSSCNVADLRFAEGVAHIASRDKTMRQANAAFAAKDYPAAAALYKEAWNKLGAPQAAVFLGRIYLYGMGTRPDSIEAISWFKKVAEGRYVKRRVGFDPKFPEDMNDTDEANISLAKIYLLGFGVPKDPAAALHWYEKAAGNDFIPAYDTLAKLYMAGYGGEVDPFKAFKYAKKAAEAGYLPAQYRLAQMYYVGTEAAPRDLKLAGAWFSNAAMKGHPPSIYAAARMYDLGEGVPADPQRALIYYKEAALKSNPDAQNALATYFYNGQILNRDLVLARKWFGEAAQTGQPDAMFNLGAMTSRGEGGEQDLAKAYAWLQLAKQSGQPQAAAALNELAPRLSPEEKVRAQALLAQLKS